MNFVTSAVLAAIFLTCLSLHAADGKSVLAELPELNLLSATAFGNEIEPKTDEINGIAIQPTTIWTIISLFFKVITFIPRTILKFVLLIPRVIYHSVLLKFGIVGVVIRAFIDIAKRLKRYFKTLFGFVVRLVL